MLHPDKFEEILIDTQHAVNKILRTLNGEDLIRDKGIIQRLIDVEKRVEKTDEDLQDFRDEIKARIIGMKKTFIGMVIGMIVMAAAMNLIPWKEVWDFLK
jgi:hypothetical protein